MIIVTIIIYFKYAFHLPTPCFLTSPSKQISNAYTYAIGNTATKF